MIPGSGTSLGPRHIALDYTALARCRRFDDHFIGIHFLVSRIGHRTLYDLHNLLGSLDGETACAASGIIVSVVIITGLGQRFTENMLAMAGGNIYLVLALAALSSLVLGTGVPLIPAYIIQVGMIIPALVEAGISPAQAHLFVIFFCAISLITPPMASEP